MAFCSHIKLTIHQKPNVLPNNALQQTAQTPVVCRRSRFASGGMYELRRSRMLGR